MTDQLPENSDESSTQGPGNLLISAREALGLTTRQVADQLHLLPRQVEALEANDYEQFNGEIFIKGYLRSYSTLLGMDSELLIQSFIDSRPEIIKPIPTANRSSQIQRPAKGYSVQYWSLVAAIIVIAVLWIVSSGDNDDSAMVADSPEIVVDKNINLVSEVTTDIVAISGVVVESESIEPSLVEADMIEPAKAAVVEADAKSEGAAALEEITADILSFSFAQDCWVEVKDNSGTLIFADLRKANSTLQLSGNGPFDILLGYAAGVTLTYNSEPINVVVNRTNDLARLTVGMPKI